MTQFQLYFGLGKDHILDYVNGYDHILFIVALCSMYLFRDWKRVLILVTAFTIGHSITLALATLDIIPVKRNLIEFLIPCTIFVTAVGNIFRNEQRLSDHNIHTNYFFALFFGLIHGMGFSTFLKSILGQNENIVLPLFAFNIGLEFGQIVVVFIFLLLSFFLVDILTVNRRDWKMVISAAVAGIALIMIKERIYW